MTVPRSGKAASAHIRQLGPAQAIGCKSPVPTPRLFGCSHGAPIALGELSIRVVAGMQPAGRELNAA
jgi:hypothetical protein